MLPSTVRDKNILIAPLNWGLGHAARTARLIKQFAAGNNRIVLASDGDAYAWLALEFPQLPVYSLPELQIKYSAKHGAMAGVLKRLPHFFRSIGRDFKAIEPILKKENIDLIVSDNRYGVYHPEIYSILVTHQLRLLHPLAGLIEMPWRNYLQKFDEIWVPDQPDRRWSGKLSDPGTWLEVPVRFIGPLSRFEFRETTETKYRYAAIISGPEPLRGMLEKALLNSLSGMEAPCVMITGSNQLQATTTEDNLQVYSQLPTGKMEALIDVSETVICRSGYSSIMDMAVKQKSTVLIPTPGQPEQLYLAEFHHQKGKFRSVFNKNDFNKYVF